MKTISFDKLYNTEFFISELMAKPQFWAMRGNHYSAIGKPKISQTLLWFKNCSGELTSKDGEVLSAPENSLVYTPKGGEYSVKFIGTSPERADTVVVHFQMTDRDGEDIIASERPTLCMRSIDSFVASSLDMLSEEYKKNVVCIPELTSVIYKLLSLICQKQRRRTTKSMFSPIRRGIELLEGNNDLSIEEIAKECGVSECYFRRLFRSYSGESPMQFRQHRRIEKAKQLLLSDEDYTVGEVAQELHFLDIYHFSKTFKKYCGVSPNKFVINEGEGQ